MTTLLDPHPIEIERPRYSAITVHEFITLEGVEFMVVRYNWGRGSVDYNVYEPAEGMTDNHSSYMHSDDGRLWGEVIGYFDTTYWDTTAYPAWSRWRSWNVVAYRDWQNAVADEIAMLAFPHDFTDGSQCHYGKRVRVEKEMA